MDITEIRKQYDEAMKALIKEDASSPSLGEVAFKATGEYWGALACSY